LKKNIVNSPYVFQDTPKKKAKVSKPKSPKPVKVVPVSDEELKKKIEEICSSGSMENLTMRSVKENLADAFGDRLDIGVKQCYCITE